MMGIFGSSKKSSSTSGHDDDDDDNDGSGFLHPESSLKSNRALETSQWSKERSSQQMELADVHNSSNQGCCGWSSKPMEILIKSLHVIDASFGMALLVYGSLICTQFQPSDSQPSQQPAMAAVVFCLVFGTILLSTTLLGIYSLVVSKGCSRRGLVVSGVIGPYIALVYLTMVVSLLADQSGFLTYLDDHKEVMYLGPNVAENCKRLMPLFYTLLIGLGLLEASRFSVLVRLRDRLLEHDSADPLIPRATFRTSNTTTANNALTEALLEENNESDTVERGGGGGGGAVGKESTGTPNWWDKD